MLARVIWLDAKGKQIDTAEYPVAALHLPRDRWTALTGTYQAPPKASQARLELHLRWAARGDVLWRGGALSESTAPEPRKVRLATVNHRPVSTKSGRENLEQFAHLVDEAAGKKADIVCLPEAVTLVGTGKSLPRRGRADPRSLDQVPGRRGQPPPPVRGRGAGTSARARRSITRAF